MPKPSAAGRREAKVPGPSAETCVSEGTRWGIAALLIAAIMLSAPLVAEHFGGRLPGCGPKSGCESLEATPFGRIPGIGWPVSFFGLAYFAALLAGWIASRRAVPGIGRWVLRLGACGSLLFIAAMVVYRKLCPYCAGIHGVNLAVLVVLELETRRAARRGARGGNRMTRSSIGRIAGPAAGAFLAVTIVLGIANARFEEKKAALAEGDRQASTQKILAQAEVAESNRAVDRWGSSGFTGRYRLGPETSPIRVVMLTDYQCPDCKRVEGEIMETLALRKDVSLSVMHFPFCAEAAPGVKCNPYVTSTLHPNSCWAARAAEAAGILAGDDGFWKMHRWLFSRGGSFTDAELKSGLAELGFSPESFIPVMTGAETLKRVQADCGEGEALGIFYSPMIFVNGVEFKGWQIAGALRRTIEEVAAKNPPPLTAGADRPVLAAQRFIDDWREQPVRTTLARPRAWSTGAASGSGGSRAVDVVLFGDYQEPYTAEMDVAIRESMRGKGNVRYTFRHFPIDPTCNPTLPPNVRKEAIHPKAGQAAKAAEAAGSIGGAAGFWKMHDWLMRNLETFSDESLRAAAGKMGIDADALFAAMKRPEITAPIFEDERAAQQLGLNAVPMVFVNGRWVPRAMRGDENIVLRIIEEAGKP